METGGVSEAGQEAAIPQDVQKKNTEHYCQTHVC